MSKTEFILVLLVFELSSIDEAKTYGQPGDSNKRVLGCWEREKRRINLVKVCYRNYSAGSTKAAKKYELMSTTVWPIPDHKVPGYFSFVWTYKVSPTAENGLKTTSYASTSEEPPTECETEGIAISTESNTETNYRTARLVTTDATSIATSDATSIATSVATSIATSVTASRSTASEGSNDDDCLITNEIYYGQVPIMFELLLNNRTNNKKKIPAGEKGEKRKGK